MAEICGTLKQLHPTLNTMGSYSTLQTRFQYSLGTGYYWQNATHKRIF